MGKFTVVAGEYFKGVCVLLAKRVQGGWMDVKVQLEKDFILTSLWKNRIPSGVPAGPFLFAFSLFTVLPCGVLIKQHCTGL